MFNLKKIRPFSVPIRENNFRKIRKNKFPRNKIFVKQSAKIPIYIPEQLSSLKVSYFDSKININSKIGYIFLERLRKLMFAKFLNNWIRKHFMSTKYRKMVNRES